MQKNGKLIPNVICYGNDYLFVLEDDDNTIILRSIEQSADEGEIYKAGVIATAAGVVLFDKAVGEDNNPFRLTNTINFFEVDDE